jgi:Flp pilus assembly protein TadD
MSAVNSYTLSDFANEIVAIEPDAVLIYAGHNEYLGVLGVGSAFSSARSPALTRLILWLQEWRLFRLLQKTLIAITGASPKNGEKAPGTLMARIAAERAIAYESHEFDAGIAQFRHNMTRLLETYQAAGIPVMIATIASNIRDQAPFSSGLAETTDPQKWGELRRQAQEQFDRGSYSEAVATARALATMDDTSAEAHFLYALALEKSGDIDAARSHFVAAKDRDMLRFRAPEAINSAIRELASRYGAQPIDFEARLQSESRSGIVGADLMVEHLHPNVRGYFLLSDTFYDAIRERGWIGTWDETVDDAAAWEAHSVTDIDRLGGEYRVMQLKSDWPFRQTKQEWSLPAPDGEVEVIAQNWYLKNITWLDAMNQALAYYQRNGEIDEAVRVAINLADAFVFLDDAQYAAGQLLLRQGQPRLALHYLHEAASLKPREPRHLLALAQAFYQAGYRQQSIDTLERLAEIEPRNSRTEALIKKLQSEKGSSPGGNPQDP